MSGGSLSRAHRHRTRHTSIQRPGPTRSPSRHPMWGGIIQPRRRLYYGDIGGSCTGRGVLRHPRSGSPPLSVSFADLSTNTPTGWAWYFGDEGYLAPWTLVNANAAWTARADASSVVLPDGHIVLTGGYGGYPRDEFWRSADNGTSWSEVNTSPGVGREERSEHRRDPDTASS